MFQTKFVGSSPEPVGPTGAHRDSSSGKGNYDDISPMFIERLAKLLERGAERYGSLNYAKGMPLKRTMQSLLRHAFQYLEGDRTEDHMAAVAANAMFIIHTEEIMARGLLADDLDDLPDYTGVVDGGVVINRSRGVEE